MADQRITQLTKLAQADVAANDVLPIVDVGSGITKKVEAKDLFQAGANLADSSSIDLVKLNQSSTTKLGTTSLADDAVTAAKLANDSSIAYDSVAPSTDNFEGRGYVNSTTKYLQVWNGTTFDQVVAPTAGIENLAVTTGKLAANAVTTAKVDAAGLAAAALATDSVITAKIQALAVTTDKLAALSVTTAKIAVDAVTADELASNAVVTASIVDANITEAKLATGAVTEAKIGTAAVTVTKVADGSLTYAKLNLADASVPGAKLVSNSVTSTQLAVDAVTTGAITALNVTTAKLADGAVTAAKIGALAVTTAKIAADAVTAAELANNSVDTAAIVDAAVTESKLASSAVTEAKIADGAVTVGKVADTSITYAKLNLANGSVPGAKLVASSVTSSQLATDSVTTVAITDLNVTTGKLADGAVTAAKIGASAITEAKIDANAVTAGKIPDGTISYAKLNLADNVVPGGKLQSNTVTSTQLAVDAVTASNITNLNVTTAKIADSAITVGKLANGSITTAKIDAAGLAAAALATDAVTTAKVQDAAITGAKLADDSATIVAAGTPTGSGEFEGQEWFNTTTSIKYIWDGTAWVRQAALSTIAFSDSTPIAFSVAYPDNFSATVTTTLDTQAANRVFVGPTTGADAAPTFRTLTPTDIPDATSGTKGIIQPGSGLAVNAGVLNHSNTVTNGTYTKVTVDSQGHVSAGALLAAADVPSLDASKITTGTFGAALLASDAVTAPKLADYSTAQIGESLPAADYIGQFFFNPLDKNIYLWDGNVWQPVGVSLGELIFGGTYDANVNEILTTTTTGAAVGLSVGNSLPTASGTYASYYVVVATGGTGTAPAPVEPLTPPDIILCDGTAWTQIDVSSTYVAQSAVNVGFTPAGTISSNNVQTAIEEVATEAANASNLTSGAVPVARGGTNISSYTKGDLLAASASTTITKLGVGTNSQVLRANSATATGLEWGVDYVGTVTSVSGSGAISVATGTTTPAISVAAASTSVAGVVQLSDSTSTTSSSIAATSTAVKSAYDLAAAALPKAGGTVTGNLEIGTTGTLSFEGATANGFETTIVVTDPTQARSITLPNETGSIIVSGNASIVNADINASAAIVDTKLATISTAGKVSNSATTATSSNTASAIVARDGSGNFTAGTITAALTGAASSNVLKAGDTMTGVLAVTAGTAALPGLAVSGDPNTGIYSPGADQVAVATNGTGRLFVNSLGQIGIGKTPVQLLDGEGGGSVAYRITTTDTSGSSVAQLQSRYTGGGGGTASTAVVRAGDAYVSLGAITNSPVIFISNETERLRITSAGLVGIGTSSPWSLSTVFGQGTVGDVTSSRQLSVGASSTYNVSLGYYQTGAAQSFAGVVQALDNNVGTRLLLNPSAGNVGIGTSAPVTRLDLSGNYGQNIVAVAALDIDCSAGNYFTKTINGASTFTVSNVPASRSYAFTLELTHTSGAITWFSGVEWPGSTAPTLTTGKTHLFMFVTDDGGTRWRASSLINYTT